MTKQNGQKTNTRAAVVLMAGRHDVFGVAANGAACPSFAFYLKTAQEKGVFVLGHKVRWGEGTDVGKAFDAGPVAIVSALQHGDEVLVPKEKKPTAKKSKVGEVEQTAPAKKAPKKTPKPEVKVKAPVKEDALPVKRQRRDGGEIK